MVTYKLTLKADGKVTETKKFYEAEDASQELHSELAGRMARLDLSLDGIIEDMWEYAFNGVLNSDRFTGRPYMIKKNKNGLLVEFKYEDTDGITYEGKVTRSTK